MADTNAKNGIDHVEATPDHSDAVEAAIAEFAPEFDQFLGDDDNSDNIEVTDNDAGTVDSNTGVNVEKRPAGADKARAEDIGEQTKTTVGDAEKAGLERLSQREEQVRAKEVDFENRVNAAVKAKLPDFRGKSVEDVLKHFEIDPEIAFKTQLLSRLSENHPKRKELQAEIREHERDQKVARLERDIEEREKRQSNEVEAKKYRDNYEAKARAYVEKLDQNVSQLFAPVAKDPAKVDKLKSVLMRVVTEDSIIGLYKGEQRDELSPADALKRLETQYNELKEILGDNTTANQASKKQPTNKLRVPNPLNTQPRELSIDDIINEGIEAGKTEYRSQIIKEKQSRRR